MVNFNPLSATLSTKTMKAICKWADRNKDGKLSSQEFDKGLERLGTMQLSAKQKQWYEKNQGWVPDNYMSAFGRYLLAVREAQQQHLANGGPQNPFFLSDIDIIAGFDGNNRNISRQDWSEYTAPPTQAWND